MSTMRSLLDRLVGTGRFCSGARCEGEAAFRAIYHHHRALRGTAAPGPSIPSAVATRFLKSACGHQLRGRPFWQQRQRSKNSGGGARRYTVICSFPAEKSVSATGKISNEMKSGSYSPERKWIYMQALSMMHTQRCNQIGCEEPDPFQVQVDISSTDVSSAPPAPQRMKNRRREREMPPGRTPN